MASTLDVHPASHDELIAAHRNVFDIWSKGLPLDEHIRYRLNSPSHSRATWFVGTLEGQVVVSLGSYPVKFRMRGEVLPGIAIGSVYTLGEFRGRGFAPRLLAGVEAYEQARGARLSVLYSDIDPDYYARLGYTLCPALEGWRTPASEPIAERLVPFDPAEHRHTIAQLYASYHGTALLSFERDEDYWTAILRKFPDDSFYWLERGEERMGYVRVGHKDGKWRTTDYALADQSDVLAGALFRALLNLAHEQGAAQFGGWLPDIVAARELFTLTPRRSEITMIKPLGLAGTIDATIVASTSRFCEIDHV